MEGNTSKFSDILKKYVFERRKANPNISESQIARNLEFQVQHCIEW